jgi:hypothetical protein
MKWTFFNRPAYFISKVRLCRQHNIMSKNETHTWIFGESNVTVLIAEYIPHISPLHLQPMNQNHGSFARFHQSLTFGLDGLQNMQKSSIADSTIQLAC